MPELVANCPRCGSNNMSFDVTQSHIIGQEYGWQNWYETFCICRHCDRATIFLIAQKLESNYQYVHTRGLLNIDVALNRYVDIQGFISLKDVVTKKPPEHLPEQVDVIFKEAATCLSVGCYNAAGTMFRLCVDLASNSMLPEDEANGLNAKVRRNLGLRLPWLFDNGILAEGLRELSTCIKDDGNDGAHQGTLSKEDVEDLLDFTFVLLERIYTEPERLRLAKERREKRHIGES